MAQSLQRLYVIKARPALLYGTIWKGAMPVYIEDEETCRLISKYAELKHSSKTGALRDLLRREIQVLERKASAEERYRSLMSWLGPAPETPPEPIPKEYYDWLAGESDLPALSPALKEELGVHD